MYAIKSTTMRKKVLDVIEEIYGEAAEQHAFLQSLNALTDPRLCGYVGFVGKLFNLLYSARNGGRKAIESELERVNFELWETHLFSKIPDHEIRDNKWMLLHIEVDLLDSNAIYEKYWKDLKQLQRQFEYIHRQLSKHPMERGTIWSIHGKKYIVGATFALYSDIWLKAYDNPKDGLQYSYRLVDMLPLDDTDMFWTGHEIHPEN